MKNSRLLGFGVLSLASFFMASTTLAAELPLQYRFNSDVVRYEATYGDVTDETYHVIFQDLRYSPEAEGPYFGDATQEPRVVLRRDNYEGHPTAIDYQKALAYQKALDLSAEFTGATDEHETRNSIARIISHRDYLSWQRQLMRSGIYFRNVSYHENGIYRVRVRQAAAQARAAKISSTYKES